MNISINPFEHTRLAKRNIGQVQKAKVSAITDKKLRKKLLPMQSSLDYMTEHYNINFYLYYLPISKKCFLSCQKGKKSTLTEDISAKDENSIIARKIYKAASEVL